MFTIKLTGIMEETVIDFGIWQFINCMSIIILYMILSVILPVSIIGKNTPYQILKSNEFEVLKNKSFSVADGELIAITGKSGAGKSTSKNFRSVQ